VIFAFTKSPHFQQRFKLWENSEVAGSQILDAEVLTDLDDAIFCLKKSLYESCRMGRCIDANSLICPLVYCNCDGHTVHKLSQRRLTADLLAPKTVTQRSDEPRDGHTVPKCRTRGHTAACPAPKTVTQYTSSVNCVSLPTD
jgi:hypothetical protein